MHYADVGRALHNRAMTTPSPAVTRGSRRGLGVLTLIASGTSNQLGAGIGALAFPVVGPIGVVVVRQLVAALVLVPVVRPPFRRFTWAQWWPILLLGVVFATMNFSLYTAIDRIGLGLGVTLEFLGPLAVALAATRSRLDAVCALAAGVGVVALTQPGPTTDYLGIGFGLLGAACWASYILLTRTIGRRLPGIQGTAGAVSVSALLSTPVAVILVVHGTFTLEALGFAVVAGIMCSVIPYVADMVTLRWVPAQLFGTFMSINPVLAALSGILILGQQLDLLQWVGILLIAAANAVAVYLAGRRTRVRDSGRNDLEFPPEPIPAT